MIGLDTNVLVRYLVRDDEAQAQAAAAVIGEHCTPDSPGWLNRIVLSELVWVLGRTYKYSREQIVTVLERIQRTRQLAVEDLSEVRLALAAYQTGEADFADGLLSLTNRAHGCETTVTFDRKAGRLETMRLIE